MSLSKSYGSKAKRSLTKKLSSLRRSDPGGFDASASVRTSVGSTDTCLGAALDDSAHALAIHAAQDRERALQQTLPPSLVVEDDSCVAPFRREEVVLGPLLGSGEYADVFEVRTFHLHAADDEADDGTVSSREERMRLRMKKVETYRQTGNARYALKHLKGNYLRKHNFDSYIQAAGDLAVEAKFLASLNHPNIIKLRGIVHSGAKGFGHGPAGYFLLIDRLNETLEDRIQTWSGTNLSAKRRRFSFLDRKIAAITGQKAKSNSDIGPSPELTDKALDERLSVALQISAAMVYMHSHRCIFRDLKPANIGFDVRGDVKIFDFGLARVLPEQGNSYNDKFKMSGAGSPRYMAPELLNFQEYNLKADVYSFAIILWQILAGEVPFAFVRSRKQLFDHVVNEQGRPQIDERWPTGVKSILAKSFDECMDFRPKMAIFHEIITKEIANLRGGDRRKLSKSYINRRRSMESFDGSLRASGTAVASLSNSILSKEEYALSANVFG